MDLHIGAILLPGVGEDEPGGVTQPKEDHTLRFGHTAVITSQEQLNLPNHIAALGFPPARLSFRGLLMTNPGHVDPGYVGLMRFTVMNVGREDITLRRGDPIVTLLFFRLNGDTRTGYAQRNGLVGPIPGPTQNEVNHLSLDFLDVSSRADAAATKAVANAEFRAKFWGILVPGVTAVATIIGALVVGFVSVWQPLNSVRTDVDGIKKVLDLRETKSRLDKLEDMEKLQKRIDELERELKSNAGPKPGGNP